MVIDLLHEREERDDCPECEHHWWTHDESGCTQEYCVGCPNGKRSVWALPPAEFTAITGIEVD